MLAVVFKCQRFHTYGRLFTVETDHKPLEMISQKNLSAAPPRLQRMLMETQGYDRTIVYRPGKEILLADRLSRLPNKNNCDPVNFDVRIKFVQFSTNKLKELRKKSNKDNVISLLREKIFTGLLDKAKDTPILLKPFWAFRDELSKKDSLVLKRGRMIIPGTMRNEILNKIHASHQGIEKSILRAKTCVYWPGINEDIEEVVKVCPTCQKFQNKQKKETMITRGLI